MICIYRILLLIFAVIIVFCGCGEDLSSDFYSNVLRNGREFEIDEKENVLNNYDVFIKVDPEKNIIIGNEKIKFINSGKKEVDSLYFNLYLNSLSEETKDETFLCYPQYIQSVYKYGRNYGGIKILNVIAENDDLEFYVDKTVLCVKLKEPLKPDGDISITINFEAKIPNICYRIGGNDKACWIGSFLPVLYGVSGEFSKDRTKLVRGLSFYDGFSNYSVNVSIPNDFSVIGSGVDSISEKDGEKIVTFNGSVVRDFAFVYGKEYKSKSIKSENGIDINFYYYSDDIDYDKIVEKARDCVEFVSQKLGSYPYTEINFVETELYSEICANYPQVIFVDSEYIKSETFNTNFCYNISQQWIYNIFGADKINEAWICEGFAAYLNDFMNYSKDELSDVISNKVDDFKNKLPSLEIKKMNTHIENFKTEENYYYIENIKAEIMFYYLSLKMGEDDFQNFMKKLYSEYVFQGINREKIVLLANEFFEDADIFFEEWLESDDFPII